jgi:hypothetical protein
MKNKHTIGNVLTLLAVLGVIGVALTGTAKATSRVVVTPAADIRVWVDDSRDVFDGYGDVVISLEARRDCYAAVFIVDTDGYVHVVRPLSPWEQTWVRGGHVYRYTGYELGLGRLAGRGIVHVFAVSSPRPFDYTPYGEAIFAGHCGFRVYGDPFVACRDITVSLLPSGCGVDVVSVSFTRFYIREWTRYPGYLCTGHGAGLHVRVGDYCRHCAPVYDAYRLHVADPYVVINPRSTYRKRPSQFAEVRRSTVKYKSRRSEAVAGWSRTEARRAAPRRVDRAASRVVSRKQVTSVRTNEVGARKLTNAQRVVKRRVAAERKSAPAKPKMRANTKGRSRGARKR